MEFILKNDILFRYKLDGREENIPITAIQGKWILYNFDEMNYWSELDVDTFEYGSAKILEDDNILMTISIASGQSGGVFIWNPYKHEVIHASNGNYAVAGVADNQYVYAFHYFYSFSKAPRIAISYAPYGTQDIGYYKELKCNIPFDAKGIEDIGTLTLDISDGCLIVHVDSIDYEIEIQ